jgi:lipoprotein-releasing system permease protein
LFTNKSKNVVNIISYISLFGVSVGTAALIIVMSVFNGFESLVLDMYNSFDPHIKITAAHGKTFLIPSLDSTLSQNKDLKNYSFILEEKVLIENNGTEIIAEIKGVDSNYSKLVDITEIVKLGDYFEDDFYRSKDVLVLGASIRYRLAADINNMFSQLTITSPKRDAKYIKDANDLVQSVFLPIGVFSVQSEYDNQFVLAPLNRVQLMLNRNNEASSVEINILDIDKMPLIKENLQYILGEDYIVKTRLEQHDFLYKLLNSEKLAVFIILTFILIIASFNIVSSLSMLIIDKQKDIKIFWNLGSSKKKIRNIFFIKGFLSVIIGSVIGLCIGIGFVLLQGKFGFIAMQGGFVVDSYPVELHIEDVMKVEITVIVIGLIASFYPAKVLTDKFLKNS